MELKINLVETSVQSALSSIAATAVWIMEEHEYVDPSSAKRWSVSGDYGAVSALHKAHRARKAGVAAL